MNSERVFTLREVRNARRALDRALDRMSDDDPNRDNVQDVVDALEDAEDLLFLQSLTKKLKELGEASKKLAKVNTKIKQDTKALESAVGKVKTAAKAIGILAEVMSKAAALV